MRNVPAAIQSALDSGVTTMTYILRIDPQTEGYDSFGITLLDRNVTYNDGDGSLVYLAPIGMVPANIQSTSEMEVGNTEIQHLFPEFDLPISEADISAGVYDFAWYHYYMVDYSNLTTGNHVVIGHGQLGQIRMTDGLSFTTELTDLTKLLMQSIVEMDSITCRATFGSQAIGSTTTGDNEERFPCGKDAEALYTGPHTVTTVGAEVNNTFTASGLGAAANTYVPGMLRWLTGDNAGRICEVEEQSGAGVISLTFETMFPISTGDTFEIRPDCTKWKEGTNGCKFHFGTSEWKLHYRGEPYIPVADADQLNTPGATVGSSLGGGSTVP